jgi:hypothetical protein
MQAFDSIREALDYTINNLIQAEYKYVISMHGPRADGLDCECTLQIVPQHYVFNDRKLGLTLDLSFDHSPGKGRQHDLFLQMPDHKRFHPHKCEFENVTGYAAKLGTDIDKAASMITRILTGVFGYAAGTCLEYEVHEHGLLSDKKEWWEVEDVDQWELEQLEQEIDESHLGVCPFCGVGGFIAADWRDYCDHWVSVDDLFGLSEATCLLTEGQCFDVFKRYEAPLTDMTQRERSSLTENASADVARLLVAVFSRRAEYWKELVDYSKLEVDVDEELVATTYTSYFVRDKQDVRERLEKVVKKAIDYLAENGIHPREVGI